METIARKYVAHILIYMVVQQLSVGAREWWGCYFFIFFFYMLLFSILVVLLLLL